MNTTKREGNAKPYQPFMSPETPKKALLQLLEYVNPKKCENHHASNIRKYEEEYGVLTDLNRRSIRHLPNVLHSKMFGLPPLGRRSRNRQVEEKKVTTLNTPISTSSGKSIERVSRLPKTRRGYNLRIGLKSCFSFPAFNKFLSNPHRSNTPAENCCSHSDNLRNIEIVRYRVRQINHAGNGQGTYGLE